MVGLREGGRVQIKSQVTVRGERGGVLAWHLASVFFVGRHRQAAPVLGLDPS